MALSGNEDALNKIEMALRGVLQEKGHFPYLKKSWIKKKLNDEDLFPNREWANPNLLNSSVQILVEEALKLSSKSSVHLLNTWKDLFTLRPHSWLSVVQTDDLDRRVYPLVEQVRQWLWNTSEAPFADNFEGRELALSWFIEVSQEADKANVQRPGQIEISILLKTDDIEKLTAIAEVWRAKQLEEVGSVGGQESVSELADVISSVDSWAINWQVISEHKTPDGKRKQYRRLEFKASGNQDKTIMVQSDTLLGELAARVSDIVKEASSWSDRDALNFILYGTPPHTAATTLSDEESRAAFTARSGEATREMIENIKEWLDILALPKPLSTSQKAVLTLVSKTPGLSWGERYKKWLEWCDHNAELPDFNRNQKVGPPSLYNTYKRAVEKERELVEHEPKALTFIGKWPDSKR